jgi:hypothetical protein
LVPLLVKGGLGRIYIKIILLKNPPQSPFSRGRRLHSDIVEYFTFI